MISRQGPADPGRAAGLLPAAGLSLVLGGAVARAVETLAAGAGVDPARGTLLIAVASALLYGGVAGGTFFAIRTQARSAAWLLAASALPAIVLGFALGPLSRSLDLARFAPAVLDPVYLGDGFASTLGRRGASEAWMLAGAGWALLWLGAAAAFYRAWSRACRAPSIPAILLLSFALLLPLNVWRTLLCAPIGDEPHYLVIAESLRRDRDIDLRDNYGDATTGSFFPWGLSKDALAHTRERHGQWISMHGLGLPVLLLPGWSAARRFGVAATLALSAAVLGAALVAAARRLGLGEVTARTAWGIGTFLSPLYPFADFAYPDPLAASAAFGVFAWGMLRNAPASHRTLGVDAASGALLGALPFLHVKFVLLSATLLAVGIWRGAWREPARRLAVGLAALASLAVYAGFHVYLYGLGSPYADTGAGGLTLDDLYGSSVIEGGLHLLMSPAAGLFPRYPALVFAILGLALWWRSARSIATRILACALPWFLLYVPMTTWHAGASAPGRYLLPIVPWLVLAASHGILAARSGRLGSMLVIAALAAAGLQVVVATALPVLWYSWRAGGLLLLLAPHGWSQAVASALISPPLPSPALGVAAVALLLLAVFSWAVARRAPRSTRADTA